MKKKHPCLFSVLLLVVFALAGAKSAGAATFIVVTPLDFTGAPLFPIGPDTFIVETLREAIDAANAFPGPDTIEFDIPPGGPQTISVGSLTGAPLPPIFDPVTIDGTTQPGFAGTPIIELTAAIPGLPWGLAVFPPGDGSTIKWLVINNFAGDGVLLGASGNTIEGNFIGTDDDGMSALPNSFFGVDISGGSVSNLITINLISGNGFDGVGMFSSSGNTVAGNLIGTDVTGTAALGNGFNGVGIFDSSLNNVLNNVISGNGFGSGGNDGIAIAGVPSTGNVVAGNFIGTNVSSTAALGNANNGITLFDGASGNTIGGAMAAERNLISGNLDGGIGMFDTSGNFVQGNFIGTDVSGTAAIPNAFDGVAIFNNASSNTIGGTTTVPGTPPGNLISGNGRFGVLIFEDGDAMNGVTMDNNVKGNLIGTDVTGVLGLGNGSGGVRIEDAPDNYVGGIAGTDTNVISGNGSDNVVLEGSGATGNTVQGNLIGTDITGTLALGVSFRGVGIFGAPGNTIGGATAAARNIISGNGQGVWLDGALTTGNHVVGNYIGTNATGDAALSNDPATGVDFTASSGNFLTGNVISGLHGTAVSLGFGANGNTLEDNFIGTDKTGTVPVSNFDDGIDIWEGSGNTIRGNVISGNLSTGVVLRGATTMGNVVQGNKIGTDATGMNLIGLLDPDGIPGNGDERLGGNGFTGVDIFAPGNIVGGAGAGNLISGNDIGVFLAGAGSTGNVVQGNLIGTDVSGMAALGNGVGVLFNDGIGNTIGGTVAGEGNLLSGNTNSGMQIIGASAIGNAVQGNFIGTDITGAAPLANAAWGVLIAINASNNTIGGTASGAGNVIAYNGFQGVVATEDTGTGNAILSNSIHDNGDLGIDLNKVNGDGVTPNDTGDGDTGPNNLQNYPVLSAATPTDVFGTLNSTPNTTFRLQFFDNPSCDPSGFGEGQTLVGEKMVTTDGSGNVSFSAAISAVPLGTRITATATNTSTNDTSEFSQCVDVKECALDVSGQVLVTRSGFRRNNSTGRYVQTVTIKNTSGSTITGPISLALDSLSMNATLFNKTGDTVCTTPQGSPYKDVTMGNLAPGAMVSVVLEFTNPTNQGITYTTRVLAGPGNR